MAPRWRRAQLAGVSLGMPHTDLSRHGARSGVAGTSTSPEQGVQQGAQSTSRPEAHPSTRAATGTAGAAVPVLGRSACFCSRRGQLGGGAGAHAGSCSRHGGQRRTLPCPRRSSRPRARGRGPPPACRPSCSAPGGARSRPPHSPTRAGSAARGSSSARWRASGPPRGPPCSARSPRGRR